MIEYGMIIGQATPGSFEFSIYSPEHRPINYEYVQVSVEEIFREGLVKEVEVLGQVKRLASSHPFYDQRSTPSASWKQRALGVSDELMQIIASAKVLGYIHEEGGKREIRHPRSPPMPGTPVLRASDSLLNEFFKISVEDVPLKVGSLLHREGVDISISGRELHRHTAILAMTRYGKSYFAGKIMEELLKRGATILTIDAHGDYANMALDLEGRLHKFFHDKITVFKPEAAERFESPNTEPLNLSVSSCSLRELYALAGIDGDIQRIILRRVIKDLSKEKRLYTIDDIVAKLDDEKPDRKEDEKRIATIKMRLEDLSDEGVFTYKDLDVSKFFKPMHMSDIFLSGLPDRVQDVFVGVILQKIFDAKFRKEPWAKPPLFIFIEEAHRFALPAEMGGKFSRNIIARIATEGAKFGLFLIIISQRPRKIDSDVLSNCSNLAILRIVNQSDQQTIRAASESFSEDLLEDLPSLEQGEAILVGPFVPVPVMVRTAGRETKHGGRTPDIYRLLKEAEEEAENAQKRRSLKLH
ncbi:ATP-binding protein [Candidatus Bathyarchaeota archaeon]|nr:ATP-binding protein [Candidatus Bathyarchaeota archaeon]MBS7630190.1 ATP-binding protein [Candidatus Bathyarchaeota archaeon]